MRAALLLLAVAGCADWQYQGQVCDYEGTVAAPEAEPPAASARTVAQVLPTESTAVDILFVIDDSSSMTDEQAQLGIWSNELFDVLATSGELPDLHIGVTSSSVAIAGITQCTNGAGGSLLVGDATLEGTRYLTDVAGPDGRVRNYTGSLTDTFAKLARVGDAGCGFEQPFKAARLALSNKSDGFLRADALLLVVFVTDEDDCSADSEALFGEPYADSCSSLGPDTSYRCFEHGVVCYDGLGSRSFGDRRHCRPAESSLYTTSVTGFAKFLKGLKANPAQVIVAGIYGKPNHIATVRDERVTGYETPRLADVCGTGTKEGEGATPAVRMNALLAEFGGRASQSSICDSQLSWAMRDVGLITRGAAKRSTCLRGQVYDVDAGVPGLQPSCHVEAVLGTQHVDIPPCTGASGRCFTLATDATACADTETHLAFDVADTTAGETLSISCDVANEQPLL